MKPADSWAKVAEWAGFHLSSRHVQRLQDLQRWLVEEALPAGGLGPEEGSRIHTRHIGDSLLFAGALDEDPVEIWDLGSGVGLPGIPLSIVYPDTEVVLVERSGRRVELLRRAVRVLDLSNVVVMPADIERLEGPVDVIVSRATLPPGENIDLFRGLLGPDGIAVVGGSWANRPDVAGWVTVEVPPKVLDHAVWLLIMQRK